MSPEMYATKKSVFMDTIKKLAAAAGVEEKDIARPEEPTTAGLLERFERCVKTVQLLKIEGEKGLLYVPGYTASNIRDQTQLGFGALCKTINVLNTADITLDDLAKSFLNNPVAMLEPWVIHGFYDRAHIEAGLEQDRKFKFQDGEKTLTDIYRAMVTEVAQHPEKCAPVALEQWWIRLKLVEADLEQRFAAEWNQSKEKVEEQLGGSSLLLSEEQLGKLKSIVEEYTAYLKKLQTNGDKSERLQNRIDAIKKLSDTINDNGTAEAVAETLKEALKTVDENQPTWMEKSFVDKLIDIFNILTLGFFQLDTEEAKWVKTIEKQSEEIKPRALN